MVSREEYNSVISRCISRNVPFVLCMPPGVSEPMFFADTPDDEGECPFQLDGDDSDGFFINFFGNDEPYLAGVRFAYDYEGVLELLDDLEANDSIFLPADVSPSLRSTSKMAYTGMIRQGIASLTHENDKIVLSQLTAAISSRPVGEVMWNYFDKFPETFRYLCFTPETGLWMGATPEILAYCEPGRVTTMALAGTKRVDDRRPWDQKNTMEHSLVSFDIIHKLTSLGLDTNMDDYEEIRFGNVVHLCNMIEGRGNASATDILHTLSPTAAIAGYPSTKKAIEEIRRLEPHSRYCYGGFVGLKTKSGVYAYVNLRCALIAPCFTDLAFLENEEPDSYIYNIYSGGGILRESDPDGEWEEAMNKCAPLLEAVTGSATERVLSFEDRVTISMNSSRKDYIIFEHYGKK